MIKVLFLVAVALAIFIFAIYKLTPKEGKTVQKKTSSTADLVKTTMTRVEVAIDKLNNEMRTPEVVERDVKNELDLLYSQKADEFKSVLNTIAESAQAAKNSITSMESSKSNLLDRMRKTKAEVKSGRYPLEEGKSLIASSLSAIDGLDNMIESAQKNVSILERQKQDVLTQSELFVARFDIAKTNILAKIAQLKMNKQKHITTDTSINIGNIIDSLNIKIEKDENAWTINETFFANKTSSENVFSGGSKPSEDMLRRADEFLNS